MPGSAVVRPVRRSCSQSWTRPSRVAGNTTRYRRRVTTFKAFEMRTRCIGWDHRFMYMEQSMWRKGECCNHMLLRGAFTGPNGIVTPTEVFAAVGFHDESPALPAWVQVWISADAQRPWPPEVAPEARAAINA